MNANDRDLQKMMDVQAQWLRMRTPDAVEIDVAAKDGDRLVVGATEFHVLHTPGHTQGSISLYIPSEEKLVAGDTLFLGQHRANGPAGRRFRTDPALDSYQTAAAAGRDGGDSGAR